MLGQDLNRRTFLSAAAGVVVGSRGLLWAGDAKPKRILLSNFWHCVNIGDIAHAPGMLRLIETHLPGTEVTLWPYRELTPEVARMMKAAFPKLVVLEPGGTENDRAVRPDLVAAIQQSDLFVVGSGGMHAKPIRAWRAGTDKPYGAYGVSVGATSDVERLSAASFLYCRDTLSVEALRRSGVTCPVIEFAPDSTFGLHLRDDARAKRYLESVGLAGKPFLAVIPRARYSPYPQIYGYEPSAEEREKQRQNEEHAKADHAAMRELIVSWVRRTGRPVLACPEMTYQMQLAKEQLVDPLPDDVKPHVVWRDKFWLCDEAAAVFSQAALLVSMDCHAPIIALVNGTPAVHLRVPTDTTKSQMFADLGLGAWRLQLSETDGERLTKLAFSIVEQPEKSKRVIAAAMETWRQLQAKSLAVVGRAMGRS